MRFIKFFIFALFFSPIIAYGADNDFMIAAQLLSAAKNADIQQVQILVNSGANINYTDSTGLSLVCTALMNNDLRAAQILQMYGADASRCDQQIKQYNSRNKKIGGGGLFGGLSSAQSITLAAAGAAVVVGGLFLLTDVFDGGGGGGGSSSGGTRPGGDGSGGNTGPTASLVLPYGPAMPNAASERENYAKNLNAFATSETPLIQENFKLLTDTYKQNYLLMMHGYSPLARGYLGMRTLRNSAREPVSLDGNNLGPERVMGGRPVNVALITTNGINAAEKPVGELSAGKNALDDQLLLWTTLNDNGNAVNKASNDMISSKYYNNVINRGTDNQSILDDSTSEDKTLVDALDLTGHGTAINNTAASDQDNLLAKILGGSFSGYSDADFMGFMPNGQMTIFRVGDGTGMVKVATPTQQGTYELTDNVLSKITFTDGNLELNVTRTGNSIVATNGTVTYKGYFGADDLLYIDNNGDGKIDKVYQLQNNELVLVKEQGVLDYLNYKALRQAAVFWSAGDQSIGGRSLPNILANASVIAPLRAKDAKDMDDILAAGDKTARQAAFSSFVNEYYNRNTTDGTGGADALPGADAADFFGRLGSEYLPLVIFSTGAFETDDSNYSGRTQIATFENAAPLVFDNLNHLFMSVVAVGQVGTGTSGTESISGYVPGNKYALSQWQDKNGTPDDPSDDKYYKARVCGVAGKGANGIDPWCFAAAGVTDELAVASAAGAAGAVQSAFSWLNNKQLFALLALTADGAYLGSTDDGRALTKEALIAHLKSMYEMPNDYKYKWESEGRDYLDVFKEVFGYGLINLERATKPTSKIFYYDGTNIVSGNGNAYWRAATNTMFRASSAFRPRGASISAPFYDILESVDGELRLPRIWENEFAIGETDKRGLYMGDVLGDLKTRRDAAPRYQIGNVGFSMAISDRAYDDGMGGLDALRLDYGRGAWNFAASYQRYFTDGASRFNGMSNPILAMASNVIASDIEFNSGNWSFGGRAFSGVITDDGLLENDPTVSSQYMPALIGRMHGAQSHMRWANNGFAVKTAFGAMRETDTILGAQTGGLLSMGAGDTAYIDAELRYAPRDNLAFTLRSTFARTTASDRGEFILGVSDIYSNAFAFGIDAGNFSMSIARPLSAQHGYIKYAHADYDVVETEDGKYDLSIADTHVANLGLRPENRELRLNLAYNHRLGEFTDGALGFIYRVNPNNTDEYGNESIFMMKISHRLGI